MFFVCVAILTKSLPLLVLFNTIVFLLFSTKTRLNFQHAHKHTHTHTHTYWMIRKWLCSSPHILASRIRLAQGCSTVRWLPLSTLCGNSRTLFMVHLSVWHHTEKLRDQFPADCRLSDLISMATVIQSSKCMFSIWVHLVWASGQMATARKGYLFFS